ncbi:hypothetical protein [Streptomyces noursei]|uniref:hypothetical protein n=1 Tax=Streptomyces noursei TaxID=1971 RepID=UPI0021A2B5B6|nr:hypothetical protein [Streptomyces noursei]UWS77595.1 hypothetical protein N1H47_40630 [Streptomyces noursei]
MPDKFGVPAVAVRSAGGLTAPLAGFNSGVRSTVGNRAWAASAIRATTTGGKPCGHATHTCMPPLGPELTGTAPMPCAASNSTRAAA